MPMHDWGRVPAYLLADLRMTWLVEIDHELTGVLEPEHYSLIDATLTDGQADLRPLNKWVVGGEDGPAAETVAGLRSRGPIDCAPSPHPGYRNRLAIRRGSDDEIVAVVEVVTPEMKSSRRRVREFVDKAAGVLTAGVHLLLVDAAPPGPFDPAGLHPLIWRRTVRRRPALAVGPPVVLSYLAGGDKLVATARPFARGDAAPDVELFLTPDACVNVSLEAAYRRACAGVPDCLRAALAGERESP